MSSNWYRESIADSNAFIVIRIYKQIETDGLFIFLRN